MMKVTANYQVTVPLEVRQQFNLQQGDLLEAEAVEEGILFRVVEMEKRYRPKLQTA